jgi:hypothetical protein
MAPGGRRRLFVLSSLLTGGALQIQDLIDHRVDSFRQQRAFVLQIAHLGRDCRLECSQMSGERMEAAGSGMGGER